jgi:hypothetical protein
MLTEDAPAELLRMLPVLGVGPQAPDTCEHGRYGPARAGLTDESHRCVAMENA